MTWEEEFKKKIVTPEEAISHVKNRATGSALCRAMSPRLWV